MFGEDANPTERTAMRKIVTMTAAAAGLMLWVAPAGAQYQYNPGGYSGSITVRPPAYAPPAYAPPPPPAPTDRPVVSTPREYPGGGYYDYRRYGDPGSRDSLLTCSYC